MKFPVYPFDHQYVEETRRLFPDGIESDEWVIFHGTSGCNAESIEKYGIEPGNILVTSDHIQKVTKIFEKLKWCGNDGGGYAILKSFSLGHDFGSNTKSLLYFAETSVRALLYATHDFSGGEKMRSLRRAFKDLESYLYDVQIREEHYAAMQREFDYLLSCNASLPDLDRVRPVDVDLEWLETSLHNTAGIFRLVQDVYDHHDHGVVYAIKVAQKSVADFKWHSAMGVETYSKIPPSSIIGKVIIPRDYQCDMPGRTIEDILSPRLQKGFWAAMRR